MWGIRTHNRSELNSHWPAHSQWLTTHQDRFDPNSALVPIVFEREADALRYGETVLQRAHWIASVQAAAFPTTEPHVLFVMLEHGARRA